MSERMQVIQRSRRGAWQIIGIGQIRNDCRRLVVFVVLFFLHVSMATSAVAEVGIAVKAVSGVADVTSGDGADASTASSAITG